MSASRAFQAQPGAPGGGHLSSGDPPTREGSFHQQQHVGGAGLGAPDQQQYYQQQQFYPQPSSMLADPQQHEQLAFQVQHQHQHQHQHQQQRLTQRNVASSASTSQYSSSSNNSFASARSATPLSRPSSSTFGTPTAGASASASASSDSLGQCRICRKLILANEPCHLCSACNQFICEDCASYSATDQHWMCSSCRRRATKPAIPADALKELGLNQNSSAIRRMTLRLNQNELKLALSKGGLGADQSNINPSNPPPSGPSAAGGPSLSAMANKTASGPMAQLRAAREAQQGAGGSKAAVPSPLAVVRYQQQQQAIDRGGQRQAANLQQQHQQQRSAKTVRPAPKAASAQMQPLRSSAELASGSLKHCDSQSRVAATQSQQQQQQAGYPAPAQLGADSQPPGWQVAPAGSQQQQQDTSVARFERIGAQKTLSGPSGQQQARAPSSGSGSKAATPPGSARNLPPTTRQQAQAQSQQQQHPGRSQQEQRQSPQHQQQQQQQQVLPPTPARAMRRASVAASERIAASTTGSGSKRPAGGGLGQRKQSTAFFTQSSVTALQQLQQQPYFRQEFVALGRGGGPIGVGNAGGLPMQPQTMITASSDASMPGSLVGSRRGSAVGPPAALQAAAAAQGATLIPIPPDQIHLRRLSDQSNLVRRSSIIQDTIDCNFMARNRSHSNIDTVNYYYQSPQVISSFDQQEQQQRAHLQQLYEQQQQQAHHLNYSDDNIHAAAAGGPYGGQQQPGGVQSSLGVYNYAQQQRRPSDQWAQQQHAAAQQEQLYTQQHNLDQQQQQSASIAAARSQQQQQLQQQLQQHAMSSIITPYAQKHRHSSEEYHSDSSSDIEEDARVSQAALEFDNEQPSEFFAPPRAFGGGVDHLECYLQPNAGELLDALGQPAASGYLQQQLGQQAPISIPSVSVSEFSSSQQRLHQLSQQQQQAIYADQIMTTPMQINVAIEQAIQQQRSMAGNELLPTQDGTGDYLVPRRGSSGRVLPRIPGEQSRSLLDLPQHNSNTSSLQGAAGDHQSFNMLGLPCQSPTIRRASAPEGQNIKIVVDDIDGSMRGAGALGSKANRTVYGKQGELFERLVLYRDDSVDPNTNMVRGFGLHVMGGKIDNGTGSGAGQESGDGDLENLEACVSWTLAGGPADKVGLKRGDKIIEWDGKCLVNMTYEQVAEVIDSSANIAELLVKPAHKLEVQPGAANYVRSQRRLSQQTERDLKKIQQQHQQRQQQQQQQPKHQKGGQPDSAFPQSFGSMGANNAASRHEWASSNELIQQQQSATSQFVPPAVSAGNSPRYSGRTGTGRRLPKIPGLTLGGQSGVGSLAPDSSMLATLAASTGQLEHSGVHSAPGNGSESGHLNALHDQQQQQSHSASELYRQQHHQHQIAGSTSILQAPAINQNGSVIVLNPILNGGSGVSGQQWPHQISASHNGGYHRTQQQEAHHYGAGAGGAGYGYLTAQDEICGLIGLQVNVDERNSQLEISVLSAINIDRDLNQDYYVRIKILPESNRFKPCTTQPSNDMNWKETFIFQNFPTQQIHRMALEIGVWVYDEAPRLTTQMVQPICEAMIPIQSARERNTDFWPLRPPPTSPHARRKSLNDLIETHAGHDSRTHDGALLSAGYQQQAAMQPLWPSFNAHSALELAQQQQFAGGGVQKSMGLQSYDTKMPSALFTRERSSSNRNLPDMGKLRVQPRRASDEVAGSSSHRLSARVSPAQSRRSISVMNVGGDGQTLLNRPSSRLGSQINLLKTQLRRDSTQQQQQPGSNSGSPVSKYTSGGDSRAAAVDSQVPGTGPVGITPSGRRSSLVGIQSMTGYRSQKNSQSDATDQDSPLRSQKRQQAGAQQQPNMTMGGATGGNGDQGMIKSSGGSSRATMQPQPQPASVQQRAPTPSSSAAPIGSTQTHRTASTTSSGGTGSRRNSNDQAAGAPVQLQRKGSFAMLTLRKLKRTMSLTKGTDPEASGSNQGSRRSSSSSNNSVSDVGEDLGVTRRIVSHKGAGYVGRLKLSFIMTKGQLEVDVVCAQGLKYEQNTSLGVYVKMYLKGKSKSNKRKTRVLPPSDSPIFRHLIKYDGSIVDNKSLEVSVWQRQGGLKGKIPVGFTEIRLSELDLCQLQVSWYNLRSMDAVGSSSVEE